MMYFPEDLVFSGNKKYFPEDVVFFQKIQRFSENCIFRKIDFRKILFINNVNAFRNML